jgi:hypothetical protein
MRQLWENQYLRVGIGLVLGLGVIMYFNPPHTPCRAEVEIFKQGIKPYLKPYKKNLSLCKDRPEPGGCVPVFETIGKLEGKVKEVGLSCRDELKKQSEVHAFVLQAMELFVKVAWGSQPPPSNLYRNGWLESSQVVLYCRLRQHLEGLYGEDEWLEFVNARLADLPGADGLNRDDAWNRSLMSDPCRYTF